MKSINDRRHYGEPDDGSVARLLPKLIADHAIDVVVGSGETSLGFGITPDLVDDLFDPRGLVITTGNHAWDKKEILDVFPRSLVCCVRPTIRPECLGRQLSSRRRAANR